MSTTTTVPDALHALSHALQSGDRKEISSALKSCRKALEIDATDEIITALAIIFNETNAGQSPVPIETLQETSREQYSLSIRWDTVLRSLQERDIISIRDENEDTDSNPPLQNTDGSLEQGTIILQPSYADPNSVERHAPGYNSNREYILDCLYYLDQLIDHAQSHSKQSARPASRSLDNKYTHLRHKAQHTEPLPPLEILCRVYDLGRTQWTIIVLVLKAELDGSGMDTRLATELLCGDLLDRIEFRKHFAADSVLVQSGILILEEIFRQGKEQISMPLDLIQWIISGGDPPPTIERKLIEREPFEENSDYTAAWIDLARQILRLDDAPRSHTRRTRFVAQTRGDPASENPEIQRMLSHLLQHGERFPIRKLIAEHRLDANECMILAVAMYGALERTPIPVDGVISVLAGDNLIQTVQYEQYFAPHAPLVTAEIIRIRTASSGETILTLARSLLHQLLGIPQEPHALSSSTFFDHIIPEHTLDDVVLPPDIRETIDTAIHSMNPKTIDRLRNWGITGSGTTNQLTMLFHGVPGVGKSMCACAIAHSLRRTVLSADAEKILSKWHGQSEHNLASLFDSYNHIARRSSAPPILLLNECDQLLSRRGMGGETATDINEHRLVSILLERIESIEGIIIGTSNLVDAGAIDSAFSRRFQYKIRFPFPDIDARYALWQAHIPSSVPVRGTIDFRALAERYAFSGGQIRIASLAALRKAAIRDGHLTQSDIMHACEAELNNNFEQRGLPGMQPIGFHR